MNIVLTGSLGNIGKPLTTDLVKKGHSVTVISSNTARQKDIETLGAKAAIGSMFDADFLTKTFKGADIVYLMETMEAAGDMFDKSVDFNYIYQIDLTNGYPTALTDAAIVY